MSHTLNISFPFNSTSLRPSLPCYCYISHSLWFLQTRGRQYWATPFCVTIQVVRIEFPFRLLPYLQQVATMLSISMAALFEYCCATHTLAAIKLLIGLPFWHQTRTNTLSLSNGRFFLLLNFHDKIFIHLWTRVQTTYFNLCPTLSVGWLQSTL